jgi:MFS family permease
LTGGVPRVAAGSLVALGLLNFFLADARDGLGPFLDAYLSTKGWTALDLGMLATMGGVLGLLAGIPAGALADGSRRKRLLVIGPVLVMTFFVWHSRAKQSCSPPRRWRQLPAS